jgi:hypothetical protein
MDTLLIFLAIALLGSTAAASREIPALPYSPLK